MKQVLELSSPRGARVEFKGVPEGPGPESVTALTAHILRIAQLDPLTISRLMSTATGAASFGEAKLAGLSDEALQAHIDSLPEASPGPLSDAEYVRFLHGDAHALAEGVESGIEWALEARTNLPVRRRGWVRRVYECMHSAMTRRKHEEGTS